MRSRWTAGAIAVASLAAILAMPAIVGAKPTADYRFDGNFKSSGGSAPNLAKVGPGGDFVKRKVAGHKQGAWQWPEGTGLKLKHADNFVANHGGTYTLVLLVNLNSVDGYRKLIDFRDLDQEAGLYVRDDDLYAYPSRSLTPTSSTIAGTRSPLRVTSAAP